MSEAKMECEMERRIGAASAVVQALYQRCVGIDAFQNAQPYVTHTHTHP